MKLVVLGSGTSVPHPHRSSSAYWLETTAGSVLLDCSAPSIHRMAQEGLDWTGLGAIWISHFHLDHCAGLAPFLFGTKHAPETQERSKPLRICGGPGIERIVDGFDKVNNYNLRKQPFPLEIVEARRLEKFEILPGVEAVAIATPHTKESHALHVRDADDSTLVFTSDTGFDKKIGTAGRDADLLLLECSFVKGKPVEIHLELAEAMSLIRYAKPKVAMLTHFYAEWDGVDFKKEVDKYDPPCPVLQAEDGLRVEIG